MSGYIVEFFDNLGFLDCM